MKRLIAVIGGRECSPETEVRAYQTGRLIAKNGFGLICGGMSGVMEASARGCKEEGGITVGVLPQDSAGYANPYIDIAIPTGMGIARNLIIVRSAEGIIAIDGGFGTLSELAFALQLGKPVVGLNTWDVSEKIIQVKTPEEAINELLKVLP
ncbi:MAG: TIGR00725 family protein [Calditrichaeota bacterium]|nr:TIGR00725 family protein [Calditrichota bacterium]